MEPTNNYRYRRFSTLWLAIAAVGLFAMRAGLPAQAPAAGFEAYRENADRIISESMSTDFAWNRLADLTDNIGNRLSGSPRLERAVAWAVDQMRRDGLENVRTEKVMVPHWVRGDEGAEIISPVQQKMEMLGLGGSVPTPPEGVEGEVLVVRSFSDLEAKAEAVKGRIVVYNVPFTTYGQTVQYRGFGASRAARYGAVAALVRSVGPVSLRTPHTGGMRYTEDAPKIPTAAITIEDAERLQRMQDRGTRVVVRLKMEGHFEPDAESANVIGEIRGRELPDEIVLIGGHLDSWDVGAGASDDGVGCIVTWEAARILKKLGLRPRRTVRVVLFTNEENGGKGGEAYRDAHAAEAGNHVLALEADSGVFPPISLGFTGANDARKTVEEVASLLRSIGMERIGPSGGGADIGPIVAAGDIPAMALVGESSRYFAVHHTPADTIDKFTPEDVSKAAAAIAVMAYVVAEMPSRPASKTER